MAVILNGGKLTLSGDVGDFYFGDFFTYADVVVALAQVDDGSELTVHLNSGGGYATEGAAIHALLSARAGTTNIVVEGIAASAASLIAMSGDTTTMTTGAVMMIHDPLVSVFGAGEEDLRIAADYHASLATSYARIYAAKSGKTADECRTIMKTETWMTGEQAVAQGFADATTETEVQAVAAFDYRAYAHAPKKLTALAKRNNWSLSEAKERAAMSAAATRQPEERSMTEKDRADQLAAELDNLKATMSTTAVDAVKADRDRRAAIMALPEAEGLTPLAEHLYATGKSVEEAKATLAVTPKATASAGDGLPDPKAYEVRRATGAGVSGAGAPTAAASSLVAVMRKQLGVKEAV